RGIGHLTDRVAISQMFRGAGCVLLFFFFSSRRRHTRSYGDWSSDVCSSDLFYLAVTREGELGAGDAVAPIARHELAISVAEIVRSEERRVGKECRSRGSPYE